jgi:hypothetical protein
VIVGGAVLGLQSPAEFEASGLTGNERQALTAEQYSKLDTVPRDGLVLRERPPPGSEQRVFYATAGAVFEVRDPSTLRAIGVDPEVAATIPAYGLDAAARVPPSGTLLRVDGTDTVWLIQGGARRKASDVCGGANVNVLPADPDVLDLIPVSAARGS